MDTNSKSRGWTVVVKIDWTQTVTFELLPPYNFLTYSHRDDEAMVMTCLSKMTHLLFIDKTLLRFRSPLSFYA